ncbi:hypothetical protein TNCT_15731 [Trichonephila clavata]|uniref:Uncharacterized protein n=1 Tax=Trichonephila clavata TaxID=2740835 RepID=A0A8X6LMY7_TRICU|nr:hypothetical protein TNCT_15731 [Trichonephila clavata]
MSDIPKLIVIDLRRLGKLDQKASLKFHVSFSNRTTARTVFSRGAPLLISLFRGQVELLSESPFELMVCGSKGLLLLRKLFLLWNTRKNHACTELHFGGNTSYVLCILVI